VVGEGFEIVLKGRGNKDVRFEKGARNGFGDEWHWNISVE
jgi:hypothetical protein